ncbi:MULTISPECIES: dihydrodipicolinate synthase family protein [unclassified Arenibacter]|uniref:dihydrodipicolinate synthase family protein n=1 Tax=unclassified Arenibacter TaxID=2615047 RepID=UPI000E34B6E7|nr:MULTISPECIES: dihydrodipicolinate synthase family protein [unclassified Arenibacter]MCM4162671.1 dihydrodipicolinate synthase family protein [Arenibacter sp. A80]RFT58236.1 dihydrodipicolinate synthase family protein [Arenibacter sp. P308M17]
MEQKLKGIIPPLITPLTEEYNLDVPAVHRLTEHLIQGGVHGLFILGTTGEATGLKYDVRQKMIIETCLASKDKIPIMVGITDTSLGESLKLANLAKEHGAMAVVAAPPYYFNLGQQELLEYYEDLANNLPLPLYLYNMPGLTKVHINTDTAIVLSKHPNIIGLKDSSANTVYFQSLIHGIEREDFGLFVGPEEITAETVLMGGDGGVNGGANLFPRLYVELYQASLNKDFQRMAQLQSQVMEVARMLYNVGKYGSSYLKGLKGAASLLGLCRPYLAPPLKQFKHLEMEIIGKNLKAIQTNIEEIGLSSFTKQYK